MLEGAWHVLVVFAATRWLARLVIENLWVQVAVFATLAGGAIYHLVLYPGG